MAPKNEEPDDVDEVDDDAEDDTDDLADLSDDELREQLRATRESLKKANGQSAKRRTALRERERELEEARRPKPEPKPAADGTPAAVDVEAIRAEALREGAKPAIERAKKAEARAALLDAGISRERVARAVGLLKLDDLDLDDDGLDGIDEAIASLKTDVPELFSPARRRRADVTGSGDRNGDDAPKRKLSASEMQARLLTGKH